MSWVAFSKETFHKGEAVRVKPCVRWVEPNGIYSKAVKGEAPV